MMTPVSGKPSGMGNPLNLYCWSMAVHGGRLYLGTFDLTTMLKFVDPTGKQIAAMLGLTARAGAGAVRGRRRRPVPTWNGRSWGTVTLTGFGDQYDYGFRNIVAAPFRLYFGLSNPFYGCQVWRLTVSGEMGKVGRRPGGCRPTVGPGPGCFETASPSTRG